MLQQLPSVTSGKNQDGEVRIFGTQRGKASKRSQGEVGRQREEDDGEATRKGGRASWGSTCYVLDLLSHNLTVDAGGIILILRGQT